MNPINTPTPDSYDAEDILDTIPLLEKSFGISFDRMAFYHIRTFGDLCDVFEAHLPPHTEDCTTQQAFYTLRKAMQHLKPDNQPITPASRLEEVFPKRQRRAYVRELEKQLGISLGVWAYSQTVVFVLGLGFLSSLVAFFFDWKLASISLLLCVQFSQLEPFWGTRLTVQTVRELTKKTVREHYRQMRRKPETVNRHEIRQILTTICSEIIGIEEQNIRTETGLE